MLENKYHVSAAILLKINLTAVILLLLIGCSPILPTTQAQPAPTPQVSASPTQGDDMQEAQPLPIPSNPGLRGLIEKAKDDLALRLSIPIEQINLLEARDVVWPDSSIGCPQDGMAYAQVLTPGYLILLEYGNNKFEYHASGNRSIIYCKNPTPPIPGTPENT